jgi:hypothetical protein
MQNQEFKKKIKFKKGQFWGRLVSSFFLKNNQVPQLLGQQGGSCWNPQTHLGWLGSAGTRRPTRWADPLGPAAPTRLGPQGPARPQAALSPAEFRGVKRPRSLGAWLLGLRWVSAHLTSTFVTSYVTKVEVPPTI